MKNILPIILIMGFFFLIWSHNDYAQKLENVQNETKRCMDSLHNHIDSLNHDIHTLEEYLDSLPLGSPLDTLIISSNYGWRRSPIHRGWRMHSGTDFFAAWSDTVYATGDGLINKSSRNFGYGRQIKISHCGGYESSYSHLYRYFVNVGDSVRLGQPIARAGNSGMVTGPHLHYEISRWNKKIDPMLFVDYSLTRFPVSSTSSQ
jgi:murein DD-endopeptidase MepM/ murein hydrolase activator NlpD